MNSQCPPCSCLEEAAQSHPCTVVAPEQNSPADPCPCQDVCPSCPCDPPQVPLGVTSGPCADPVKIQSSGEEPFTFESPGMCLMRFPLQKSILTVELCPPGTADAFPLPQEELGVTETAGTCLDSLEKLRQELPAAEPCALEVVEMGTDQPCQAQGTILGDPCASQSGISMDPCTSQSGISIDPCVSQSGISMDPCTSQSGISTDPCTSQSGISTDPCTSQSGISTDPCMSQSGISTDPCTSQSGISTDPCTSQSGISTDPCASQSQGLGDAGDAKDSKSQASPRSPFRLNSCTSSIVERCLSRCQSWFRGKK
ncbi:corneodesmosin-like [Serinus canaria]|uniref:corneodesmosin-like n=1 Tax=Serinus canaria TaxID=9135 RepID=UPI0021CCFF6F|nr:corneodesmosin-like [Serinus canaria]